jgi:putative nucleotidyltransferase with HDIG domain
MSLTSIILAAGTAARLGRFKPLVKLEKSSLVERVIDTFRSADVPDIIVVAGHRAAELADAARPLGARVIVNDDFKSGMFSSVLAGLKALPSESAAFFLLPVDIPLIRTSTLLRLIDRFHHSKPLVCYPTFRGERGHPPLISTDLTGKIVAWPGDGGLRPCLAHYEDRAVDVPVADAGILQDMDTPEDYEWMKKRAERLSIPTTAECDALLTDGLAVPEPIRRHCRVVAQVAASLTDALNRAGCDLDPAIIRAAALLHDVARTAPNHAEQGAAVLRETGFSGIADIVESHMDLTWDESDPIGPKEVLFLADKLVSGDRMTSLTARFQESLDRFPDDPAVREAIRSRRQTAEAIRRRIESLTGRCLSELLATHP